MQLAQIHTTGFSTGLFCAGSPSAAGLFGGWLVRRRMTASEGTIEWASQLLRLGAPGVERWNAWRQEHAGLLDLSGIDLSQAQLRAVNLRGVKLWDAQFAGADLTRAQLAGAYLNRSDLSGAQLTDCDLAATNLRGAEVTVFRSRSRWHGWVRGLLVSWVALERTILSLWRAIYLERPGCHVTLRCSRTRSSGMLRRFPVFSDATEWHGQAFTRVREGARTACHVTGSGSRRRRHGMPCRWVVFWNPIHRVALPQCRKSRPQSGVRFQGYPEVCRSCARHWPQRASGIPLSPQSRPVSRPDHSRQSEEIRQVHCRVMHQRALATLGWRFV